MLLPGHVLPGSSPPFDEAGFVVPHVAANAEIGYFEGDGELGRQIFLSGVLVPADENVGLLDVEVGDALGVDVPEPLEDLVEEHEGRVLLQRLRVEAQVVQASIRGAFEQNAFLAKFYFSQDLVRVVHLYLLENGKEV